MTNYKKWQEEVGVGGGAGAVSPGMTTLGVSGAGDNPDKTVPVSKKKQKQYVAAANEQYDDEQNQKVKETTPIEKQRIRRYRSGIESKKTHGLRQRTLLLQPRKEVPSIPTPSSGVSNRMGSPRKVTGAINMLERFSTFHEELQKRKAKSPERPVVAPETFMTKEETVDSQKNIIQQNSKTEKNPTGVKKTGTQFDSGQIQGLDGKKKV